MTTTSRPYHLYDAQTKAFLPWRYYVYSHNAHIGALIEARWAKVGTTIEVVNVETGRMLGQYTRHPTTVSFLGR